jgi:hypothetical protein
VKTLLKLGLAAAIIASTYFAIVRVAEDKASARAGGHTFPLDRRSPQEWDAFSALLDELRDWGQGELAAALVGLQEKGDLWVAPDLAGGRSAICVHSLRLVSRVYVRREDLLARELPFPDLDVPDTAQRTFTTIRLAGTLLHELQHYDGLEGEGETYDREIEWYRELRRTMLDQLEGDERRLFEWAVDSAIQSAAAARDKAAEAGGDAGHASRAAAVRLAHDPGRRFR